MTNENPIGFHRVEEGDGFLTDKNQPRGCKGVVYDLYNEDYVQLYIRGESLGEWNVRALEKKVRDEELFTGMETARIFALPSYARKHSQEMAEEESS